jgi:hypothetical protein
LLTVRLAADARAGALVEIAIKRLLLWMHEPGRVVAWGMGTMLIGGQLPVVGRHVCCRTGLQRLAAASGLSRSPDRPTPDHVLFALSSAFLGRLHESALSRTTMMMSALRIGCAMSPENVNPHCG